MRGFSFKCLGLVLVLALGGCATTSAPLPEQPLADDDDDDAATINLKLGIGYMQQGRFDLAQAKLKKALEYNPGLAEAYNALGVLFEGSGDSGQAELYYGQALEQEPKYTLARMNYGRLLCASGKTEQGEQQFLQVVRNKLFAMPEIAYTGAGICARARNDLPLAESYFHQALDANPYAAGTLLELASLSFEQKKFLDARQYLQRYHQRVGYSPGSLDLAIKIEEALGDTRERDKYSRLLEAQLKPSA